MNEESIDNIIHHLAKGVKYPTMKEYEAYKTGARMMYDFMLHNPNLLKSQEAEQFYEMCLFPSVINL